MSDTDNQPRKLVGSPYAWGVLGLLTLIYISSFVDRQIIAVLATQIQQELSLSNLQVGALYGTAFSLIYAACGIPMGWLADRGSRKRIIIAGLVTWSLMTAVSGFATSLAFLVVARLLVGVSQSALSPAVYSLLADYFRPDQRATVYSIYASGIFVGIGTAYLAGGAVAQAYDWRTALIAVGLPGLLIAALAWWLIRELPRGIAHLEEASAGSNGEAASARRFETALPFRQVIRYLMAKRTLLWHFLGFSFLAFTGYVVLGFVGTVLTEVHGAGELIPHYGWFMLATGGSVMLAGRMADRLARRWGPSFRFVMGMVAGLACLPLYYAGLFAGSGTAALVGIGLANVISSSYNGVAAALIQYLVPPNMRAVAGSLYLFVISVVGFGVGPPLTGWLMDAVFTGPYGPSKALMTVIAACGVLGTACFLAAMKHYGEDAEGG
ncbi:MAG: MFS transporter [Balneolaceae bacterium]|nr:MFS transporter [Balneolaceae bacterium]